MLPDRKLSFGSGALATAAAYRFWKETANGRLFDAIEDFRGVDEERREPLELVVSVRAWQPAFSSWLVDFRTDVLSIVPNQCRNDDGTRGRKGEDASHSPPPQWNGMVGRGGEKEK